MAHIPEHPIFESHPPIFALKQFEETEGGEWYAVSVLTARWRWSRPTQPQDLTGGINRAVTTMKSHLVGSWIASNRSSRKRFRTASANLRHAEDPFGGWLILKTSETTLGSSYDRLKSRDCVQRLSAMLFRQTPDHGRKYLNFELSTTRANQLKNKAIEFKHSKRLFTIVNWFNALCLLLIRLLHESFKVSSRELLARSFPASEAIANAAGHVTCHKPIKSNQPRCKITLTNRRVNGAKSLRLVPLLPIVTNDFN